MSLHIVPLCQNERTKRSLLCIKNFRISLKNSKESDRIAKLTLRIGKKTFIAPNTLTEDEIIELYKPLGKCILSHKKQPKLPRSNWRLRLSKWKEIMHRKQ